jgi:hypothetical protein
METTGEISKVSAANSAGLPCAKKGKEMTAIFGVDGSYFFRKDLPRRGKWP